MTTTAESIKKIRKVLCISQAALAYDLGITVSAVSCYETGRRQPSYKTVRKILELAKKNNIKITFDDLRPEINKECYDSAQKRG